MLKGGIQQMPAVYSESAYRHACAAAGITQKELAEKLGITSSTLWAKAKSGRFTRDEIAELTEILHLENPGEVFFIETA